MTPGAPSDPGGRAPERAVVIGGGISGLVAAYRLSQAGSEVTVVEPGPIGGKLQTSIVAGRPVDEAADAFLLRVPWAVALCHDLDIDGELVSPAERTAHVFVDGARHPLPEGQVLGVPTDLDALAASGIVTADAVERAHHDLTAAILPTDPGTHGPDVAVGPYLRGRLGDEVVDRLIDPLLGGISAGDTARMSLAATVPQIDAAARSGDPSIIRSLAAQRGAAGTDPGAPIFATPLGGMARLIDALVGLMPAVQVLQGRSATGIELVDRTGPGVDVRVSLDDGRTIDADAVVVACPAHVAGPLLSAVSERGGEILAELEHSSIAMVTLALDAAAVGDVGGASGCLVARGAHGDPSMLVTAVSYATSKWAQLRDPARGDVILRASAGRHGDARHEDLDDDALTEAVLRDLDRIVGIRGAPTAVRVGRWRHGFPQYAPGHLDRVAELEHELDHLPIAVAGMALRGVGIPACIQSAELAAARLGATWPTRRSLA